MGLNREIYSKSENKNNPYVRAALFEIYEGKCFYEKTPIRYREMTIDHIIPESYKDKPDQLKRKLNESGLPEDFDINCLYNLVPTHGSYNYKKNNDVYPTSWIVHSIYSETSKKANKISDKISELKRNYKFDKDLASLSTYIDKFESEKQLEIIYNTLSGEGEFNVERQVYSGQENLIYKRSLPNVKMNGHVPNFPNNKGSCLITFNSLRLRDCMITLNHNQILEVLLDGYKTPLDLNLRNFIIKDRNSYFVQLGNTRVPLDQPILEQLCEIIDDFADIYMKKLRENRDFFRKDIFPHSPNSNEVKLLKVSIQLWQQIMNYVNKYDYENGDTSDHIFDATASFIKIHSKDNNKLYDEGHHAFLIPEQEKQSYIIHSNNDVWITWTDDFFLSRENKKENYSCKRFWSPEFTYNWLVDELIPKVIYDNYINSRKDKLFIKNKTITFEEFQKELDISSAIKYKPDYIKRTDKNNTFYFYIDKLQRFYGRNQYKGFYSKSELKGLYEVFQQLLSDSDIDDLHYISKNLPFTKSISKSDILKETIVYKNSLIDNVVDSFTIDLVLRNIVVIVRDLNINLSEEFIDEQLEKLNPFINRMEESFIQHGLSYYNI
ncbi:HNH endonuclease [Pontibacillus salicampi]|uniref:HNH endonuclease n=1 Tax=Pontibacillus salicampi TaxID=1449801 RepID=A0ABV6LUT1_9BACI